jgi:hypothetical protein
VDLWLIEKQNAKLVIEVPFRVPKESDYAYKVSTKKTCCDSFIHRPVFR